MTTEMKRYEISRVQHGQYMGWQVLRASDRHAHKTKYRGDLMNWIRKDVKARGGSKSFHVVWYDE